MNDPDLSYYCCQACAEAQECQFDDCPFEPLIGFIPAPEGGFESEFVCPVCGQAAPSFMDETFECIGGHEFGSHEPTHLVKRQSKEKK